MIYSNKQDNFEFKSNLLFSNPNTFSDKLNNTCVKFNFPLNSLCSFLTFNDSVNLYNETNSTIL